MSSTTAHLTELTLEQLAEGMLSGPEQAQATSHVDACGRCRAELDAYRMLFTALEGLPRFAPSAGFGDAVMARVHVGAQPHPVVARLHRWMPSTRRGWTLLSAALTAPALPVLALAWWVLSQPLVTLPSLWQWAGAEVREGAQASIAYLLARGSSSGLLDGVSQVYAAASAVPLTTLSAGFGILAIVIPLSAWSLLRLTRTPMEDVTYAN